MANDCRECWDLGRDQWAQQNASIHSNNTKKDVWNRYAYLKADQDIEAYSEVITCYGETYKLPVPPLEIIDLSMIDDDDHDDEEEADESYPSMVGSESESGDDVMIIDLTHDDEE